MGNRRKIINGKISRREMIKMSALAGSSALLAPAIARASTVAFDHDGSTSSSPAATPFVDPLPIPPVVQPVASLDPPPNPAKHQRFDEFLPQKYYIVRQKEAFHTFHRDYQPSKIWGYDGLIPGPVFHARYGEPILARFYNDLPANNVGFGHPETSIHLHNSHSASESDGFPGDFFPSGQYKDNHYPNIYAGGDSREALGTLWYHDHRMDFTAQNTYKGLAGLFLLFDEKDSGNENDTNPNALRLPSGAFDVPLVFFDKSFDANHQLVFDQFNLDGILGDRFCVNGKIQPYFNVARRKYRFRMLNAGPSRFYEFFLSNNQSFVHIANDGNLLPAPVTKASARLSVAERADVIIDFSQAKIGDVIYLINRLEQRDGQGPNNRLLDASQAPKILKFVVDRDAADPSRVPATLRTLPPVNLTEVVTTRTWEFSQRNGVWTINDKIFDVNRVDATIKKGTAEKWILRNGFGWHHPIHIHFEEFQILKINGSTPTGINKSRKDVVELRPNDQIEIFMRFRDFTGKYVMHCHNTIHEDHAMMVRFDIVP